MSAPPAARKTSRGRIYELPDGETLWSVTTIIKGGLPAPALMAWGMRTVAEYAVTNQARLAAMVRAAEGEPDAVKAVVDWLKGSPYRDRERAADLGTAVHAAAEAYALGKPTPVWPAPVAPFMASFERFLADFEPEYDVELAEATVVNRKEQYAGTLDAIIKIAERRLLVDYKTGKDVYPEAALQLAAYAHAETILLADGSEHPLPAIDGAAVLHLRPADPDDPTDSGYRLMPVRLDETVWRSFLFVREVFRWIEDTSKTVIGQRLLGADGVRMLYGEAA
ncbi:MAG TPA: hypothetical protein VFW92_10200 [Candidatus Limnocylindrales bacterium]|nr:hypothetical protein [Candidatus Limnocylindrales bacterium]